MIIETKLSTVDIFSFLGKGSFCIKADTFSLGEDQDFPMALLSGKNWDVSEEQAAADLIHATLSEIIENYAKSHKKIGLMLSGGFDSTVLAILLKRYGQQVVCYTSNFTEFGHINELEFSLYAADYVGMNLRIVNINYDNYSSLLQELINEASQPLVTWTAVTQLAISKAAQEDGCDILLSGLGSDEVFGGFSKMGLYYGEFKASAPDIFWDKLLKDSTDDKRTILFTGNMAPIPYDELAKLFPHTFSPKYVEDDIIAFYKHMHAAYPDADLSAFMSYLEVYQRLNKVLIPDFKLAESITQVPIHYPFLDHKLLYGFLNLSVDLRWKFKHQGNLQFYNTDHTGIDKYILRLAFQKEVPERIQSRKPMGYTTPFAWWIKNEEHRMQLKKEVDACLLWNELDIDTAQLDAIFQLDDYIPETSNQWQKPFQIWILHALSVWYNKLPASRK